MFDIKEIITALKSSYGKGFLDTITMQLHHAIHADFTFIARLNSAENTSKTLSLVSKGQYAENFEYSLDYTPCADVSNDDTCIYPEKICTLYPDDKLLVDMGVEGYVGAPLHQANGQVFGLVVALYQCKIENPEDIAALFELFSGRIAAEIERDEKEQSLKALNDSLEYAVEQRTEELESTIEQLKNSQKQLIQKEKMASLGRLVAGVAHEVNTPLGVSVLASSTMESVIEGFKTKSNNGRLTRSDMQVFLENLEQAQHTLHFNLTRTSDLIAGFKRMASDYYNDKKSVIRLIEWADSISTSFKPWFKQHDIEFITAMNIDSECQISTYPAQLTQVVTNILENAMVHAFLNHTNTTKMVTLGLSLERNHVLLVIKDNGSGMNAETLSNVFEPFYTTSRSTGIGLGMSIVHNLVTNSLGGTLQLKSNLDQGTSIAIHLPC
ncbi:Signal transduction histidine kinase regulating C4-dicarboxylate transport system-like protein [Pseudoalteromonas luteoviolacea B = ATCC 29581]|nr:Signal transduction histidine kinase regulating C4-dicarboxylate transport system-like protein [Pseudoalteromonas luteoviolacea B = ATCC 29581]